MAELGNAKIVGVSKKCNLHYQFDRLHFLDYAYTMKKTIDGQPRSTWYYRKSHSQDLTFTEAARMLGITRQAVHRTARKIGVKTAMEVVDYYQKKRSYQVSWEIVED